MVNVICYGRWACLSCTWLSPCQAFSTVRLSTYYIWGHLNLWACLTKGEIVIQRMSTDNDKQKRRIIFYTGKISSLKFTVWTLSGSVIVTKYWHKIIFSVLNLIMSLISFFSITYLIYVFIFQTRCKVSYQAFISGVTGWCSRLDRSKPDVTKLDIWPVTTES